MTNTSQKTEVADNKNPNVLVLPKEEALFVNGESESFEAWRTRKLKTRANMYDS